MDNLLYVQCLSLKMLGEGVLTISVFVPNSFVKNRMVESNKSLVNVIGICCLVLVGIRLVTLEPECSVKPSRSTLSCAALCGTGISSPLRALKTSPQLCKSETQKIYRGIICRHIFSISLFCFLLSNFFWILTFLVCYQSILNLNLIPGEY